MISKTSMLCFKISDVVCDSLSSIIYWFVIKIIQKQNDHSEEFPRSLTGKWTLNGQQMARFQCNDRLQVMENQKYCLNGTVNNKTYPSGDQSIKHTTVTYQTGTRPNQTFNNTSLVRYTDSQRWSSHNYRLRIPWVKLVIVIERIKRCPSAE